MPTTAGVSCEGEDEMGTEAAFSSGQGRIDYVGYLAAAVVGRSFWPASTEGWLIRCRC
ncbi:hypothetical protein ACWGHA_08645 [Streptomyces xanthophaeus]